MRHRSAPRQALAAAVLLAAALLVAQAPLGAATSAARRPARRPARVHVAAPRSGALRGAAVPADRFGGFADSGAFLRYVGRQTWGRIGFRWDPDGTIESGTLLGRPGPAGARMRLVSDAHGVWRTIWLGVRRDSALLEHQGDRVVIHAEGRTDTVALEPGTVIHGPPALLAQAIRSWNPARGGKQGFPVLLLARHFENGTIEPLAAAVRKVGGHPQRFTRWRYTVPGTSLVLWADARGRVCLADDGDAAAGFVRVGYEALRDTTRLGAAPGGAGARRDATRAGARRDSAGARGDTTRSGAHRDTSGARRDTSRAHRDSSEAPGMPMRPGPRPDTTR